MATIKKTKINTSLTVFTINGVLTCEEILFVLKDFFENDVTLHQLWDYTDADLSGITQDCMERIIALSKSYAHIREKGKTSFVASEDLSFGLTRMYEILTEISGHPIPLRVFRSINKALSWIESDK